MNVYKQMRCNIIVERKTIEERGGEEKELALIKSLITRDRKDALEVRLQKIELNVSADYLTGLEHLSFQMRTREGQASDRPQRCWATRL